MLQHTLKEEIRKELPPQFLFMQMATSNWLSQSLYAAAKLGIADLLVDGNKNYEELAKLTHTHERSLYRLLRALASVGIFAETEPGYFTLTLLANYLRSDIPESLRAMAIMNGEEQYRAWGDVIYTLQTGESAFDHLYKMNIFDYYHQNPEPARIFDEAMTSYSVVQNPGVVLDYDFSNIKTLIDVGGGNGKLLTDIMKANSHLHGILFEQSAVIERAKPLIESTEIKDRCQLVAGDFFEYVPSGGDACIMKMILHDWDDERAIAILKNCHKALPEQGKVLIVDQVIPPGNQPSFGKLLDMHMLMVCPGGYERTEEEFRVVMKKAGFELVRIVPTRSAVSVIEGVRL